MQQKVLEHAGNSNRHGGDRGCIGTRQQACYFAQRRHALDIIAQIYIGNIVQHYTMRSGMHIHKSHSAVARELQTLIIEQQRWESEVQKQSYVHLLFKKSIQIN